ncbi:Uma2 family endonuclease [Chamaesiphon sp.]|uniref:Uma2 family endonuclease n=1 Tax=Chamaesiphon sp. TaxID=2814140 RepID=UPI003593E161
MTAVIIDSTANKLPNREIFYPSSDGEPLAETSDHLYAIVTTLGILLAHLKGQQATVLADQFLYYAQGFPRLRVAPDVMVIFGVEPGGRDNYKTWEEGQVPAVIFEMTSSGTKNKDDVEKKHLYQSLGVTEYWQFDPRGEWIPEKLRGYRLYGEEEPIYIPVTNNRSEVLQLQLAVEDKIIAFYRLDNGVKLLPVEELNFALEQQIGQTAAASQRAEAASQRAASASQRAEAASQRAEAEFQRADREAQRTRELEAQIVLYQQRLGELPTDTPNLFE